MKGDNHMAFLISEQKHVEDNIFKYENRLNSEITRFLDKSPVFVTYYHVNPNETTVDGGFKDIENILGDESPLRFQKIENFPLYGLEPVQLAIEEADEGLNTSYQSECVILPNTIKPLQNDLFVIKHVKGGFVFRVIGVQYDNIRPDNFYKIEFKFTWLDEDKEDEINEQVVEKFTCVLENIGSENQCIIQEDYFQQITAIDNMYNDMVNTFKAVFYSERYNCFLGEYLDGYKVYDPLQSIFMNKNKLLNKKTDYTTILLDEGFADNKRKIKYEKSIYRAFERRDTKYLQEFPYATIPAVYKQDSAFARWSDTSVMVVDIPEVYNLETSHHILTVDDINAFKMNGPVKTKYKELMQKFIRNEEMTVYDIPLDLLDDFLAEGATFEMYIFTPIILYIIQTVVRDFLKTR